MTDLYAPSEFKCQNCGQPVQPDNEGQAFDWLAGEFVTRPDQPLTCKDCWLSMPAEVSKEVVLDHRGDPALPPVVVTGFGLSSNYWPDESEEELEGYGKIIPSARRGLDRAARRAAHAARRY